MTDSVLIIIVAIIFVFCIIFDIHNRIVIWKNKELIKNIIGKYPRKNPLIVSVADLFEKNDMFLDRLATKIVIERCSFFILILFVLIYVIL